jgi:uncharacterized protein YjbI with pentapeptide repeats
MANEELVRILKSGVREWNAWRRQEQNAMVDFSGAGLNNADLGSGEFSKADFSGADLNNANLGGADLSSANLRYAYLNGADFVGAHLLGADFSGAQLAAANLSNATIGWTNFVDVDLSTSTGLDTVRNIGPSSIGIDTFFKSKGNLPEVFLRGAGVPEEFITYGRSLVGNPIQFYSCFISYSTKDQEFADRLYADLQAKQVRCWFAPHDVQGGKKLYEQIDEAIRLYDKLLLILSPASMGSEWVKTEIKKARKRELREKRRRLFPIRLVDFETLQDWECHDAAETETGKDSAAEIREYFIPDFSQWKTNHDAYKSAFDRLLHDLRAEPGKATSA